jgi:nitrogen-specific signal transduction histidine kinase/CheY-like chemotaxis protein
MIEDVTEVKRTHDEALARQNLESLGVLAGGIAHDFNNLLGSIHANAELVLAELSDRSSTYDGVQAIIDVADRAADIVRQMMAYAGQESGAFESVDVSQLVNEMLQLLKVSISKNAVLKIDLPPQLPTVAANSAQIRQVIMNLIMNASEAIGEGQGGVITIATSKARLDGDSLGNNELGLRCGDYVLLEVSDTGCGMTEETQAKIFAPFFTTKFTGRGMGLAAVQGIIRSHGGTITVKSALGEGSRFEVLLPGTSGPAKALPEIRSISGEAASLSGTVLLVEDEDALRIAVSKLLRKSGFTVIEADNGNGAVDLFRANPEAIDVVVLDMTLPGIHGREVLVNLRRIQPEVKVIMTSAYSQHHAISALATEYAGHYIRKPYQLRDLVGLLRKIHSDQERKTNRAAS